MEPYRDRLLDVKVRVDDLLARMTVLEKIAQLGSVYSNSLLENQRLSTDALRELMANGIGQVSAIGRMSGLSAPELASLANQIQRFLVEETRLGVPAILHEECLNGFRAKGATIFPQNIGLASAWDIDLTAKITAVIGQQMRACGVHQGLAPVLDVARDPRWGRTEETFGEDPYLVAMMGLSYVRGLQTDDISRGVVATPKHFVGHGLPEGGMNCAPAHIPARLLREVYLAPFEKVVKEGGALSVMNAYHEIDGVPCGASSELLTDTLRSQWGFDGIVVSDYYAVEQLLTVHRICSDKTEAAALALSSGIDSELPRADCFALPLLQAIERGQVPVALVDRAVSRVLSLKFRLGLFENPYVVPEVAGRVFDTKEHRVLALEAARKSIVLLKNFGDLLPLDRNVPRIAVIGPNADSQRNLLGDYSYPSNAGYEMVPSRENGKMEVVWKDEASRLDRVACPEVVSILTGIRDKVRKATEVMVAKGCDYNGTSEDGLPEAVRAARSANVAVVVVGGKSGLLPECTSGEMRDRAELGLLGVQEKMVRAVYETGTPIVLVIVDGRPCALGWIGESLPAIIEAWLPGEEGGRAVADVLFGDYNPGGKLPVSFPEKPGQVPVYYGHKPSGRRSSAWGDYVDGSARPLFEFGYGLSYTTFAFSGLDIKPTTIPPDGAVSATVDVENTGRRGGEEVVQLYVNDIVASVTRPVKELKAFRRVYLEPGERTRVEFRVSAGDLACYDRSMQRVVEPGEFKVMVGRSSADIVLEGRFRVESQNMERVDR